MKGKPKAPERKRPKFRMPPPPAFTGFAQPPPEHSLDPFATRSDEERAGIGGDADKKPPPEPLSPRVVTFLHTHLSPAAVCARATESMSLKGQRAEFGAHLLNVVDEMKPRDALERMLIQQTVVTLARVLRLADLSDAETTYDGIRIMNELVDRASNTFRRQVLALAEYRRPHAVPAPATLFNTSTNTTINAIEQINIAGQQVIQDHVHAQTENATNERGCSESAASQAQFAPSVDAAARSSAARASQPDPGQPQIPAAALPAYTGRAGFASLECLADQAVGAVNRTANG